MNTDPVIAIAGVTGAVGAEFIATMDKRRFPVGKLKALASARSAADLFDLRCDIREQLIAFLQQEHPTALPHARAESLPADAPETQPGAQRDGDRPARTAAP